MLFRSCERNAHMSCADVRQVSESLRELHKSFQQRSNISAHPTRYSFFAPTCLVYSATAFCCRLRSFSSKKIVGKSSIVNALLGEQRVIVSEIAGTTRDAIDTKFIYNGLSYVLIDTAGIRRKSRINVLAEKYSVIRSLRSMERADVVLLILNAAEGIMEQDKRVAGYIQKSYKANIIVFNKWDLVDKDTYTINTFE